MIVESGSIMAFDLSDFIRDVYPAKYKELYDEYINYIGDNTLCIGNVVESITSGFRCGADGGTKMVIIEESENEYIAEYIECDGKGCIDKKKWRTQVKLI